MSIQEVCAEQLAELFHHYHQALGPDFGLQSWKDISEDERHRMTAAARLTLLELDSLQQHRLLNYFVKPGEAEWGC